MEHKCNGILGVHGAGRKEQSEAIGSWKQGELRKRDGIVDSKRWSWWTLEALPGKVPRCHGRQAERAPERVLHDDCEQVAAGKRHCWLLWTTCVRSYSVSISSLNGLASLTMRL